MASAPLHIHIAKTLEATLCYKCFPCGFSTMKTIAGLNRIYTLVHHAIFLRFVVRDLCMDCTPETSRCPAKMVEPSMLGGTALMLVSTALRSHGQMPQLFTARKRCR